MGTQPAEQAEVTTLEPQMVLVALVHLASSCVVLPVVCRLLSHSIEVDWASLTKPLAKAAGIVSLKLLQVPLKTLSEHLNFVNCLTKQHRDSRHLALLSSLCDWMIANFVV